MSKAFRPFAAEIVGLFNLYFRNLDSPVLTTLIAINAKHVTLTLKRI